MAAPVIPVDRMVGEALALAVSGKEHLDELTAAGMDASLVEELQRGAHALSAAQAELLAKRGLKRTMAEVALEEQAVELRADLIAAGRFALRSDADAQAVLDRIQEGDGLDDLIQDLRALAVFARDNRDALARIGAQPDVRCKLADKIADELEQHLAGRRAGDRDEATALDLRNRAATHLNEMMSEIRATGAYVFRKNPRVVTKFRSAYWAAKRAARKSKGSESSKSGA